MNAGPSPHEVLGLRPGADRQAVDAAYKRLIKQYHPDTAGGDGEAARAIIHAYRRLTRAGQPPAVIVEAPPVVRTHRRHWKRTCAAVALAVLLWWAPMPAIDLPGPVLASSSELPPSAPAERPVAPMLLARVAPDGPAVEAGVDEAERLGRVSPELVRRYSRLCAADLARLPVDGLLDHCLAFDMAAAQAWLVDQNMAARHEAAARRVLEDRVLAEARVREIRRLVERRLVERAASPIR